MAGNASIDSPSGDSRYNWSTKLLFANGSHDTNAFSEITGIYSHL